jgi:hypothetical protein
MSYKLFQSLKIDKNDDSKNENKIEIDDTICDFYEAALKNDLNDLKVIYFLITNNKTQDEIDALNNQYLHQITGIAAEYGFLSILEWLLFDIHFQIDSFQLFLISCENSRIDVIKWGIDNEFELLPQHVLHAVRNGQLEVLQYVIENAYEEDQELFFSEPFIRNAIEFEQYEIIEFYQQHGIDIKKYLNNDEEEIEEEKEE